MTIEHEQIAREIIEDTLWAARRYADGRKLAAIHINECIDRALSIGIEVKSDILIGMYARNKWGEVWNPKIQDFESKEVDGCKSL